MTMKSPADAHATEAARTELLRPVTRATGGADATEKLAVVTPATEQLTPIVSAPEVTEKLDVTPAVPVSPVSPAVPAVPVSPAVPLIPAQRQDSRPGHTPAVHPGRAPARPAASAQTAAPRSRWEHLPTERHPAQPAVRQSERASKPTCRAPHAPKPLWQRSAVKVAPARGPLAAAGFAACDYLIRTVSVLGLLAVVGMVNAGTAQTHASQAQTSGRAPGTTVATAPAHPGSFTSTRHH